MLQVGGPALRYVRLACLALGAAAAMPAGAQQDYTVEELKRIGEHCRTEADFQSCIDRVLASGHPLGSPQAPPRSATPAPPPAAPPAPPPVEPPPVAAPEEFASELQAMEFCRAAMRYRDVELHALWKVALERSRKGKVYEEARAHLAKTRREIEATLAYAEAAQVSLIVLQIVKLNADLIMDLLRFDPALAANPVAQLVFDIYDRHRTIDDQVNQDFRGHIPKWLDEALGRAHPKVKQALDAVVNYAENAVRLGKSMQEPSLRKELEERLAQIDRELAAHAREIREGPVALRAINRVKFAIERACGGRQPSLPARLP